MLARGLSVRDIEDAFKDEDGRLLLSKTAVSQLGERLWEGYPAFAQRDHFSVALFEKMPMSQAFSRRGRPLSKTANSAPAKSV
jgi:hypothetical protein